MTKKWFLAHREEVREYNRKYYLKNRKLRLKNAKRYYKRNKKYLLKKHQAYLLTYRYNFTKTQFDELLRRQDGKCGICQQRKKLVVDHNHKTRQVRGLLCRKCNANLAAFDNKFLFQNTLVYLGINNE